MKAQLLAYSLFILAAATPLAAADKEPKASNQEAASSAGGNLKIVDLTDSTLYDKLERDELVRITAQVPSGGTIDIKVTGPARLDYTADIQTVKMGMVQLGVLKREYVIKRTLIGSGEVQAVVKVTAPGGGSSPDAPYHFQWK